MASTAAISAAPTPASDVALLRRFLDERDESAFAEIVRRYAGMVYAACYRVLHDRQLAEDATQETFLKLMRRPGAVHISVGGWLHRAATQQAIDVSRSESARRRRELAHSTARLELLDDQHAWREISEVIDRALLELTDEQREVLVQHFIRGRPQKEIAEEWKVSVATICRRVSDAMEALRTVMRRGGMSLGVAILAGDFLALRGIQEITFPLQQELGKMTLLAGVKRGWTLVRPAPRPTNLMHLRDIELSALVIAGAAVLILSVLLVLGYLSKPAPPPANVHHGEPTTQMQR